MQNTESPNQAAGANVGERRSASCSQSSIIGGAPRHGSAFSFGVKLVRMRSPIHIGRLGALVASILLCYLALFWLFQSTHLRDTHLSPGGIAVLCWSVEDTTLMRASMLAFTPMRFLRVFDAPIAWRHGNVIVRVEENTENQRRTRGWRQ